MVQYRKCIFSYNFLNTFFSLVYLMGRMQYVTCKTYETGVNQLLVLQIRLLVKSRLFVVKFWDTHKL